MTTLMKNINFSETLFDEDDFLMHRKTYLSYLRQATAFMRQYCKDTECPSDGTQLIRNVGYRALELLLDVESKKRTTDSWRKLRRAFVVYYKALGQDDMADMFAAAKNPTPPKSRPRKTGKLRRLITVSSGDLQTMLDYLADNGDFHSHAMCVVADALGLRPSEMTRLNYAFTGDGYIHVHIPAKKQTKRGALHPELQRGIARELVIPHSPQLGEALLRCSVLDVKYAKRHIERIRKASVALWPRRTARFCLYSLRYSMGSHLKAAHANDPEGAFKIAAILGHKKTSSARVYGNIRSGSGGHILPVATAETVAQVIDDRKTYTVRKACAKQPRRAPSSSQSWGPTIR